MTPPANALSATASAPKIRSQVSNRDIRMSTRRDNLAGYSSGPTLIPSIHYDRDTLCRQQLSDRFAEATGRSRYSARFPFSLMPISTLPAFFAMTLRQPCIPMYTSVGRKCLQV
jgi:hypothetical protein